MTEWEVPFKVTDLKAFIYDIMMWGDNVKELKMRLAHWERAIIMACR
jgi:hypothetical protein